MTFLFIALGLAMDAVAVSIANGATFKGPKFQKALTVAIFFGAFQAGMPVCGWLAGVGMRDFISGIDHWIAFALLCAIGGKMIHESVSMAGEEREPNNLGLASILALSVATSIDALAVGMTFAFLKISIIGPILLIGGVTFIMSLLGFLLGKRFGHLFENRIEIAGGLILIGIGTKILAEHLIFY
ncbi:MAG: manganese efflux pump [Nitrospinae bacterium]|nr:manganese efflux pump [Nitrospinota bacterium]